MDGWPAIFVVTCRDVEEGEELLGYYGKNYADAMKEKRHRKRKFGNFMDGLKVYLEKQLGEENAGLLTDACEL